MSDAGTDSFVGVVIVLVAAVAVVAAVSGDPLTPSPSGSPTASSSPALRTSSVKASTNIPGGALFGCTGDVISNRTVGSGSKAVNLKVYYSTTGGGRNCAVATKTGAAASRKGSVEVTLHFAGYDGKAWPKSARHRSSASASKAGAVYLDDADGRCVSAAAVFTPADGSKRTTVDSGRVGCG
ncbi:MAG TPA: hypothetical protein VIT20_05920 [Propionibacteriaceae bacterium]